MRDELFQPIIAPYEALDICGLAPAASFQQFDYLRGQSKCGRVLCASGRFASGTLSVTAASAFLFFVFHICKNNVIFVPTLQRGGGSYPPRSWKLNRYFKCDSDFPNFNNNLEIHVLKFWRVFSYSLSSVSDFSVVIPFDYDTKIVFIFDMCKYFNRFF